MKKILTLFVAALFGITLISAANPTSSLLFNGQNGCKLATGDSLAFNVLTEFTVEAWVNFASTGGGYIMSTESGALGNSGWVLKAENNKVIFSIGNGTWSASQMATTIKTGQWFQVAATYKKTTVDLVTTTQTVIYINGVPNDTLNLTEPMHLSTKKMVIGDGTEWIPRAFNGRMADVRFWNVARTPQQIAANFAPCILTGTETGLVANWKMNEKTGDVVGDAKGTYNIAKPALAVWAKPELPESLAPKSSINFTGVTGAQIGAGTDAAYVSSEKFTVEAWVNFSDLNGGYVLSAEDNPGNVSSGWVLKAENGVLMLSIGNGSWSAVNMTSPINLGTWFHVAASYEKTGATTAQTKIYCNGVLEATRDLTALMKNSTEPLTIGDGTEWPGRKLRGKLADVRFWNVVRTAEEIAAKMVPFSLTGTETGLVSNWKMNEGTGNAVADATGKTNVTIDSNILTWNKVTVAPIVNSLLFNGTNGSVLNCGKNDVFTKPTAFTTEAWVKLANYDGAYVVSTESGENSASGWVLKVENKKMIFSVGNGNWSAVVSKEVFPCGKWIHVAGTYKVTGENTAETVLYLDGVPQDTLQLTEKMRLSTNALSIGDGTAWPGRYFRGNMSDVRYWNVARTPEQIVASMAAGSLTGWETGLVANWKMNEGTGDVVSDVKGAFSASKPASVAWKPFAYAVVAPRTSLQFIGANNIAGGYIDCGVNTAYTNLEKFTVEAWTKFSDLGGGYVLSTESNPGGVSTGWVLKVEGGMIKFSIGNSSWSAVTATTPVFLNQWFHVAATYEKTGDATAQTNIYINGVKEATLELTKLMNYSARALFIGEGGEWTNRRFKGEMADARIWNVVRTPEQIAANMTAASLAGTETGLVGDWKMNEGQGLNVADATGTKNATIVLAENTLIWHGDILTDLQKNVNGVDAKQLEAFVNGESLNIVNNTESALTVSLYNIAGIKVLNFVVKAGETFAKDLSSLNGVYFLKGVTVKGEQLSKKVLFN